MSVWGNGNVAPSGEKICEEGKVVTDEEQTKTEKGGRQALYTHNCTLEKGSTAGFVGRGRQREEKGWVQSYHLGHPSTCPQGDDEVDIARQSPRGSGLRVLAGGVVRGLLTPRGTRTRTYNNLEDIRSKSSKAQKNSESRSWGASLPRKGSNLENRSRNFHNDSQSEESEKERLKRELKNASKQRNELWAEVLHLRSSLRDKCSKLEATQEELRETNRALGQCRALVDEAVSQHLLGVDQGIVSSVGFPNVPGLV